jgi:hypothetical protein
MTLPSALLEPIATIRVSIAVPAPLSSVPCSPSAEGRTERRQGRAVGRARRLEHAAGRDRVRVAHERHEVPALRNALLGARGVRRASRRRAGPSRRCQVVADAGHRRARASRATVPPLLRLGQPLSRVRRPRPKLPHERRSPKRFSRSRSSASMFSGMREAGYWGGGSVEPAQLGGDERRVGEIGVEDRPALEPVRERVADRYQAVARRAVAANVEGRSRGPTAPRLAWTVRDDDGVGTGSRGQPWGGA